MTEEEDGNIAEECHKPVINSILLEEEGGVVS